MSVLVALLGALVGAAIGVALTYATLSGEGVNALVWLGTGIFYCVPCTPVGAVAAGLLCRLLLPGAFVSSRERSSGDRYGVGAAFIYGLSAALLVLVAAPVAAVYALAW